MITLRVARVDLDRGLVLAPARDRGLLEDGVRVGDARGQRVGAHVPAGRRRVVAQADVRSVPRRWRAPVRAARPEPPPRRLRPAPSTNVRVSCSPLPLVRLVLHAFTRTSEGVECSVLRRHASGRRGRGAALRHESDRVTLACWSRTAAPCQTTRIRVPSPLRDSTSSCAPIDSARSAMMPRPRRPDRASSTSNPAAVVPHDELERPRAHRPGSRASSLPPARLPSAWPRC